MVQFVKIISGEQPIPQLHNGVVKIQNRSAKDSDGQYRQTIFVYIPFIHGAAGRAYFGTKKDWRIAKLKKLAEREGATQAFIDEFLPTHQGGVR